MEKTEELTINKTAESRSSHPCFSGNCRAAAGRLHLPVSPDCNIRCRFCRRGLDAGNGSGPGLSRSILPVDRVVATVRRARIICPELAVVGVAGPGDALASPHALEAFRLVRDNFPDLLMCLSTNGLMLQDRVHDLTESGIGFITVTINAVAPAILTQICGGILLDGVFYPGDEGATLLIKRQEQGIRLAVEAGIKVKVNMVLVPGINDTHVGTVAAKAAAWGAQRMNIIPLIPQGWMSAFPAPTAKEQAAARAAAAEHLEVMTNCARCRADACGVPGISEHANWLYGGGPGGVEFSHG
ncbi:MAG: radical SAM protein [Lentisphaerota bacterium]